MIKEEERMKVYPMIKVRCNECEFVMLLIFIEHADEIGIPLYCPHCGEKTEELK